MNADDRRTIALVGNPNVGKSTIFNQLSGGTQHTGNWSGKTVEICEGEYEYKGRYYHILDLPGTYSLGGMSEEERIAAAYIVDEQPDCMVIVLDSTCLERGLAFALQALHTAKSAAVCLNLFDEAEKKGIEIDVKMMAALLGVPVIKSTAICGTGLTELKETIRNICDGFIRTSGEKEKMPEIDYVCEAQTIYKQCIRASDNMQIHRVDRIILGRWSSKILLLSALFLLFWTTIYGANYISNALELLFSSVGDFLCLLLNVFPAWVKGVLYEGVYLTTAKVVAVMMPPMMIFFPVMSYFEDLGLFPRISYLLDRPFERCGCCGKQAITMSMGLGCNGVGVVACRIISSKTQRLIAIITNSFVPCNGRFPTLILLTSIFFSKRPFVGACIITLIILVSIAITFLTSKVLSKTVLSTKEDTDFVLQMPTYRRPRMKNVFSSIFVERVVRILRRAITVAAPAGLLIWLLGNIQVDGTSALRILSEYLEPIGSFLGVDGVIILALVLSFPANELMLPLIVLILTDGLIGTTNDLALRELLLGSGWTVRTALCTMLLTVFHWPCSTTCLTIHKETGSWKWTLVAIVLPTLIGASLCALIAVF